MRKKLLVTLVASLGVLMLFAGPAAAQEAVEAVHVETTIVFYLLCMCLVFLMHPAFAMLEAGMTGAQSVSNILMKNMIVLMLGFIVYWAVGWGITGGESVAGLFGSSDFFAYTLSSIEDTSLAAFTATDFMFGAVFAATAATIVSGAVAGRINLLGFTILAIALIGFIYPAVAHWGWTDDGWLADMGFHDFAGSTIVHLVGGVAAITAAAILGPRPGKYDANGKPRLLAGHSSPLAILGVFLLFLGWFGFNGGSVLPAPDDIDGGLLLSVGPVVLATALSASAGGLTAIVYSAIRARGKTDVSMAGNGILAGLVGITAGADVVAPIGALIIGVLAGILVSISVPLVEKLGIDDAVGAFSVHGACGVLGTIAIAFWHTELGLFYGSSELLVVQIVGPLATTIFVAVTTGIICFALKAAGLLRVDDDALELGLDVHEHGIPAYNEGLLAGAMAGENK